MNIISSLMNFLRIKNSEKLPLSNLKNISFLSKRHDPMQMIDSPQYMDPRHRDLMLMVLDGIDLQSGNSWAIPHVFTLYHHVRFECIFKWLIRNRITGQKFVNYIMIEHKKSVLNMAAHILKKVDMDVEKRKIYSKDFRPF